ncbi:MAG: hypothetical protein JST54_13990 [Deltaproteobacteria bacterium]|nr:hypothetical protein [Deltaproteobacteria bacterium]
MKIVTSTVAALVLGAANLALAQTAAPTTPAPAPGGAPPAHDAMMMHEGDRSIPGDSPIFKNVKLDIVYPKEGEVVPGSEMEIKFKLTGYELPGQGPGPHVHVIIDNQPYQPDYDATKPFKVTGLSPGPHTLRAFPSRPWHESIKAPHAFAMTRFFVGKKEAGKNLANWPDPKKPLLTYSRPKGNYAGEDAKKVMIDFYLTNAKLSPTGDKVKLVLDGEESMLTEWKPVWKEGLKDGVHKISLDLLDKSGKPIENVFNHTEREFTINAAPNAPTVGAPTTPNAATQPAPTPAPAPAPPPPAAPPAGH